MKTIIPLLLLAAVLLTGCSTPYQQSGFEGGYQDSRLSENTFAVRFGGNSFTNKETTSDFALLRAAEVCKEYNFKYFTIEGNQDMSMSGSYYAGSTTHTTGDANANVNVNRFSNTAHGTASYSETTTTTPQYGFYYKPGSQLVFTCYDEKPTGHVSRPYLAEDVIRDLKKKHDIK